MWIIYTIITQCCIACARKGSGLGKYVHDATDLSLSFVGYLSSTHFVLLLSCTALIVSLFRTPRDGFKVAVFIWYVCRCLPQHSVSVQSPTALLNSRFKTFFNFKPNPPSEFYIPSLLSWIKLFAECCQRYEPCTELFRLVLSSWDVSNQVQLQIIFHLVLSSAGHYGSYQL